VASGYGADPYLAPGQMSGDQWTPGSQTYSDPSVYPGNQYPGAPLPSGDWQARRYDSDGNQILWEEPLPPGARGT